MKKRSTSFWGWQFGWLLAAALPLLSCYRKNSQIFSAKQMWLSAGVLFLAVALGAILYSLFARIISSLLQRFLRRQLVFADRVFRILMALGVAGLYLRLMLYPLTFEMTRIRGYAPVTAGGVLVLLFALYSLIAWRLNWKGIITILMAFNLWQGWGWRANVRGHHQSSHALKVSPETKKVYDSIRFKEKPNIYFMVLESYHGADWLQSFCQLDNSAFVDDLTTMGFTVYSNAFANYYVTVQSLYSIFSMAHHYNLQDAGNMDAHGFRPLLSGGVYNPVLEILKNNGYRIEYLLADTYLYFPEMAQRHLDRMFIDKNNPFYPLATLVWPIKIEDRTVPNYREHLLEELFKHTENTTPRFVFMKAGVRHIMTSEWPPPVEKFKKFYTRLFEAENLFLQQFCSLILENDPDAVIILAADHGAFVYSYGWWDRTANPNTFIKEHNLDPEMVVRDNTDVFLAIKLPGQDTEPLPVRSLINLFPELFHHLNDNPELPSLRAADDCYSPRRFGVIHRLVRDGKPLTHFERIGAEELSILP